MKSILVPLVGLFMLSLYNLYATREAYQKAEANDIYIIQQFGEVLKQQQKQIDAKADRVWL